MNKSLVRWFSLIGIGVAAVAVSGSAKAQEDLCPAPFAPQQVIFLFDQSASMLDDSVQVGKKKWQVGLAKAISDLVGVPLNSQISIIGFGNNDAGDLNYYHVNTAFGAGQFKTNQTVAALNAALSAAAVPGNYNTPLAAAACDALNEVWTYNPNCTEKTRRDVYIYSDGLENSSPDGSVPGVPPHMCWGPHSNTQFNAALAGQGFGLESGSWERKVANLAYNAGPDADSNPLLDAFPWYRPVVNVNLLFDTTNNLSSRAGGVDGRPALSPDLQANVDAGGIAFFKGLAKVSFGSYTESKLTSNGTPSKLPHVGDTDPSPTRSCVDQADSSRVLGAMNRTVRNNDPNFSGEDLAMRDVNNDLVINVLDFQLVMANYGQCS